MATILVIEDQLAMRSVIVTCLRKRGYNVVEAENGREGLKYHESYSGAFDLVICDLMMPGLGGLATIRTLQERAAHLPVLVISGASKVMRFFASSNTPGVRAYLAKPFELKTFVEAVERLLVTSEDVG